MLPKKLLDFAGNLGLNLTHTQQIRLATLAQCVWQKKDFLNLTAVQSMDEIYLRHLADGLQTAAYISKFCAGQNLATPQLADMGAGCGYIGFALAVALPQAHVTLIESLERRCKFMNWTVLQTGFTNVTVQNVRLGQGTEYEFDAVTERAMGQLPDIFDICINAVKPGGLFVAFQGEHVQTDQLPGESFDIQQYQLPFDRKTRFLAGYIKNA